MEYIQLTPFESVFSVTGKELSVLNGKHATLEVYSSLESVGLSPLSKYKVSILRGI